MPPIFYFLTRAALLIILGHVELVGPVDAGLGRLIIADLDWGRAAGSAGYRSAGCRSLEVWRKCGGAVWKCGGWAPAPVNAAAGAAALLVTWRRRCGLLSSNYSARGSGQCGGGLLPAAPTNTIIGVLC